MRLLLASDVHTEFHADGGRCFIQSLDPSGIDVLVLAGDITVGAAIPRVLEAFCERFSGADVVYVHGNHEYYGSTREQVLGWTAEAERACPNLHFLDGRAVELRGRRFLGAPLWFRRDPAALHLRAAMSDFSVIRGFESWVYAENARALDFLGRELEAGDIVVTHYLPTPRSIAPEWRGDPLNPFFVCDVTALLLERRPELWLHGHTHASLDYRMGATRVLCNPFGYAAIEENRQFSFERTIDVGPRA